MSDEDTTHPPIAPPDDDGYAALKDTPTDDEAQYAEHEGERRAEEGFFRVDPPRVRALCWSFNDKTLQRCDQEAGHDGDHAVRQTWTDDESFDPLKAHYAPLDGPQPEGRHLRAVKTNPAFPVPEDGPVEVMPGSTVPKFSMKGKCVICGHGMHVGPCGKPDGEFPCDCSNGVPE